MCGNKWKLDLLNGVKCLDVVGMAKTMYVTESVILSVDFWKLSGIGEMVCMV